MAQELSNVTIYRGINRGPRVGFRVSGNHVHDSGLIYNDEHHVAAAIDRFFGRKDKDGNPIRGSNISMNRHCELGRKAQRMLRDGGVPTGLHMIGNRT